MADMTWKEFWEILEWKRQRPGVPHFRDIIRREYERGQVYDEVSEKFVPMFEGHTWRDVVRMGRQVRDAERSAKLASPINPPKKDGPDLDME